MNINIIYEDDAFIVIDKPSGMIVNKAQTTTAVVTVQDFAEEKLKIKNLKLKIEDHEFSDRGGVVHRLDKETSGLLLIAKTPGAFFALKTQFQERTIEKRYKTLVHGKFTEKEGTISATVGRLPWNRERFGVLAGGREAVTKYLVEKEYSYEKNFYTLLSVFPKTGRTHQIRIHLKYINRPVVSDKFYAGRKTFRDDLTFCPRLFLHAYYLKLKHPVTGEVMEFTSELPEDLLGVLGKLKSAE
ncbi:MAG: Pseudouridine synthase [Candidatus Gottesmanbacteria bacterium GW2011_GWC2_39_8]|uniref:Pseudouridine synthase n=1 Tax=Candidatus Gottesmanbacteria bacterium GW2011_GWC2_39_8 TaxID=1618450 RepID=A0A0G0PXJ9_9BACT|nr:MAG: Pseudouridine synthase [Candidatus Gottesmanbacteria bacterium GW2011_GWC2_39_8]